MRYLILFNLLLSFSVIADEFFFQCESSPEEVLREQFCKKPSEVLCNGNFNIDLNVIKEAVGSVKSSYEAAYTREYLEARRVYLERNGINGSEHLIASVPVSDLSSCHPSSSDDEEVCEQADSYYVDYPHSYYERSQNGGIENFRHRYRDRQYRLFDKMTADHYDRLIGNSEQVEEFVWDLVFEIVDSYKEKIKAAKIFSDEDLEKRFQKIEQDIEDSSLVLRLMVVRKIQVQASHQMIPKHFLKFVRRVVLFQMLQSLKLHRLQYWCVRGFMRIFREFMILFFQRKQKIK